MDPTARPGEHDETGCAPYWRISSYCTQPRGKILAFIGPPQAASTTIYNTHGGHHRPQLHYATALQCGSTRSELGLRARLAVRVTQRGMTAFRLLCEGRRRSEPFPAWCSGGLGLVACMINDHLRIKPLALASGHGRYITKTQPDGKGNGRCESYNNRYKFITASLPKRPDRGSFTSKTAVRYRYGYRISSGHFKPHPGPGGGFNSDTKNAARRFRSKHIFWSKVAFFPT